MLSTQEMLEIASQVDAVRSNVRQRAETVSPELAARISRVYQANPGMDPEALLALALSNVDEQQINQAYAQQQQARAAQDRFRIYNNYEDWDYEALRAGDVETYDKSKRGPGFNPWVHNAPPHPKTLPPGRKITKMESLGFIYNPETQKYMNPPEGIPVEAPFYDPRGWLEKGVELAYNEVVQPVYNAASWGLDKITPDKISDPFTDMLRGTTRWGFAAVQWTPEIVENLVFGWLSSPEDAPLGLQAMVREFGVAEGFMRYLANAQEATEFGQAIDDLLSTGKVDTGSGFFIGDESQVKLESDALKYKVRGAYTGGEQMNTIPKSFGTFLGQVGADIGVWDRDSTSYDIASGFIDGVYDLVVDPTNLFVFGIGDDAVKGLKALDSRDAAIWADAQINIRAAEQAGNTPLVDNMMREALNQIGVNTETMTKSRVAEVFRSTDPARVAAVSVLRQEAGIIREGGKRFVILPEFAKFLTTGRGRSTIDRLVGITDRSDIQELFKWRIGNITAREIAEADNAEGVIRALIKGMANPAQDAQALTQAMPHLGVFSIADKKLWVQRKMAPYTRLGNLMPSGTQLSVDQGRDFVRGVDQLMRVLPTNVGFKGGRYGEDFRKYFVNAFIDAFAANDIGKVWELKSDLSNLMENMLVRLGYDSTTARQLTVSVQNQDRIGTMRWVDQLQGVDPVNTAPQLAAQLLQTTTIIDQEQMLRIIRDSGRLKQALRNSSKFSAKTGRYQKLNDEHRALVDAGDLEEADKISEKITKLRNDLKASETGDGPFNRPDDMLALSIMRTIGIGTDRALQFWKSLQLFRAAYVLRTVPDDAARAYFSGAYRGLWDYIGAVMASFDRTAKGGVGRYLSAPDQTRWTRSAREVGKLEAKMDSLRMQRSIRLSRGDDAGVARLDKEISQLDTQIDEAWANFESTTESLGAVLVSKNRTDALRATDRTRFASHVNNGGHVMARKDNVDQLNNWVRGVIERLSFLSQDEPAQMIARALTGIGLDDTPFVIGGVTRTLRQHIDVLGSGQVDKIMANYFHSGPGQPVWAKYSRAMVARGEPIDPASLSDALTWTREVMREMAYVAGQLITSETVPKLTVNLLDEADPELLKIIATGRFNGKKLYDMRKGVQGNFDRTIRANDDLEKYVREFANKPNSPTSVFASSLDGGSNDPARSDILGAFFQYFAGIPQDVLVRDPFYRRILWKQTAQLVRLGSKDEAAKVLEAARKAKIDDDLLEILEINARGAMGDATVAEITQYAHLATLDYQREVLFDTMRRGSTADALRRVVSFGDAWYEGWKQWISTVTRQRGKPIKSLMKGIEGGRDATVFGPDELYVWDSETGEYEKTPESKPPGFFYQDPTSGEWGYNLPLSAQISSWAAGQAGIEAPGMPLFVPLQNLNMTGAISAGLGPIGSMVINPLIPNSPAWDGVVQFLNPFGAPARPGSQAAAETGITQLLPGYMVKSLPIIGESNDVLRSVTNFFINLFNNPWYTNFQNNTMKSLMSTGNYDSTASGADKLLNDTQRASAVYGLVWSLAQFIGPGAPTARLLAEAVDPETGLVEGNVMSYMLIDDANKISRAYAEAGEPPHRALQALLNKYGPNVYLYDVPNTRSKYPGTEISAEWWDWYRTGTNTRFVSRYPDVGAFFGAAGGEFDLGTRGQLLRNDLINTKTPEELAEEGRRGAMYLAYNTYREKFPEEQLRTEEQRVALAAYAQELEEENELSLEDQTSRLRRAQQLLELTSMYTDYLGGDRTYANVLESDIGWAAMTYMQFRSQAQKQGVERFGLAGPDSWASANAGAVLRDGMRRVGQYLSQGYEWTENGWVKMRESNPGFARLYSFVLEREMTGELDVDDTAIVEYRFSPSPELQLIEGGM